MRTTTDKSRETAGTWLRDARLRANITQREIARAIGLEYISMVSQIEAGKSRVPPGRYADYARALKMKPQDFVRELLKHYDREAWNILFGAAR